MLDNNYLTLYKTDFYEMRTYFIGNDVDNKDLIDFETKFSYANLLYVESKKCIAVIDDKMNIVGESKIIYDILETDQLIFNMLKEVYEVEK